MPTEHEWLAEQFEANRGRLRAVALRMLGSSAEADDAVQEAWLRFSDADTSQVENLGGWLVTVVARVCLDMLRSRKSRREELMGEQLAEPVVGREDHADPEHQAVLADSVGVALLVVLETLAPDERLAFVGCARGRGSVLRAGARRAARATRWRAWRRVAGRRAPARCVQLQDHRRQDRRHRDGRRS
jgi:RNA polymerase sigma factor (sigma-70 family)